MDIALLAVLAGILTVLSPCILPLLPVILSGSLSTKSKEAPYVIIASSAFSIFIFTMLLKGTSLFLGIPSTVWFSVSGIIILLVGLTFVFPEDWEKLAQKLKLQQQTSKLSAKSKTAKGNNKNIILGLSLGPVFTSCSPTYAIIVASILPVSLAQGVLYILLYVAGLSAVLLAIVIGGQKVVHRLSWFTKPAFLKVVGVILVITGLLIATGLIKDIEMWLVQNGINITQLEFNLMPKDVN